MSEPTHPFLKWTQPLKLEERQGHANRSVAGGLDRFLIDAIGCWERENPRLLKLAPEVSTGLQALSREFSQYLALEKSQRRRLIQNAMRDLREWREKLEGMKTPTGGPQAPEVSLQDLIPAPKLRAFRLLGLKNLEDLFYYTPKWAVDLSRLVPISQGNGEDPGFYLAQINGVSQTRRGKQEAIKVNLQDGSGRLTWVWFNRPYLKKEIENGRWVLLHDRIQVTPWGRQVVGRAGAYEFLGEEEVKALREGKTMVFYPSTPTLGQVFWRSLMEKVLEKGAGFLDESLTSSGEPLRRAAGTASPPLQPGGF